MFFFSDKIIAVQARQEKLNTQKNQKKLIKEIEKQRKAIKKN